MKKIKFYFTAILLLVLSASIAQHKPNFVGNYSQNGASYFIQSDNTFIIVAYATLITGKWHIENNLLKLIPKNPDFPFVLYGYNNPNVKGTKIMFSGFNDGDTFIALNENKAIQRVFNEDANCLGFLNVHLFTESATKISFSYGSENTETKGRKMYIFKNDNNYNDFVAHYISQSNFREPIIFKINGKSLKNRYNEELSRIESLSNGDLEMIKEINKTSKMNTDIVYYNPSYKDISANEIKLDKYNFNKSKNAYLLKTKQVVNNSYHDLNVLYRYSQLQNLQISNEKKTIVKKTLFHFQCK
ncbi:hypothetical protein [Flavobacterium sharifuzzamanii]|uniref:hypothetical protein n=1 Tax=Flavobacterium sharifuzzamanii TaxID=2211133 RepID=UPI000DACC794|nr:hypothetical protein [Flavobacterium sharifuzzamanii]KAF2079021.1 hypothetical protein DMA14_21280 [Flavobacterium sharifuzzamanii]